jgi:hypothetical protein
MTTIFERLTLAEEKATTIEARIAIHSTKLAESGCRYACSEWEKNRDKDSISYWWISAETFYTLAKDAVKLVTDAGMESSILYTLQDARGVAFNEMTIIVKEIQEAHRYIREESEGTNQEDIQQDEDPVDVSE